VKNIRQEIQQVQNTISNLQEGFKKKSNAESR